MTHLASFMRLAGLASLAFALVGACGGRSASDGVGAIPSGGSAGANTGNTAGKPSKGGTGAGGSDAGGSTGKAGASTGTAGSSPNPACTGPSVEDAMGGGCLAAFNRWWHDEHTGVCMPIIYGGCGATENNYESLAACQKACPVGKVNYDGCELASECVLLPSGCCGPCDNPNFSAHDLVTYNSAHLGEIDTCYGDDVQCERCLDDPNGALKFFVPDCVQGQCAVMDLRTSDLTACDTDKDCRLRLGSQCCEGCGEGTNLIAVRNDGSFEKQVCGATLPPCLPCVGTYPESAVATCQQGHCTVAYDIEL